MGGGGGGGGRRGGGIQLIPFGDNQVKSTTGLYSM